MSSIQRSSKLAKRVRSIIGALVIYGTVSIPLIAIFGALAGLIAQAFSEKVISGIVPLGFTFKHWYFLYSPIQSGLKEYPNIWPIVANTLYLAGGTAGLVVLIGSLSGYAMSRIQFKGREGLMQFTLILHAFPGIVLLVALFIILNKIGLYGKGFLTLTGVMVIKAGLEIPMASWIMKGFFDNIPWDIEMSAMVDGCTKFKLWRKVIFPLVAPGAAAVSTLSFISGWGEFVLVFTYIAEEDFFTLPVFLRQLIGGFMFIDWGLLAAVGLFYSVPTVILFLLIQKVLLKVQIGTAKGVV